ncbi:peptidylprolyl isomerase [Peptoniphilus equinus]|uniref:Peptidylprolyl isomerase n=1 Tax=Peptoniphilus equinus TaxID=3016343 RepID=A0ABY7QVB9_9FIRM|nr:peptidylprolyl isomerase [Peptoniphilus equinus]WBW50735.1 peptidylprolyl isomerase [Peptoniphilus equinus]
MEKQVLATIDGEEITTLHYQNFLSQLNPQMRQYYASQGVSKEILDELISQKLLVMDARDKGLDKDEAFQDVLKTAEESLLMTYALGKALEAVEVSDDEVAEYYEAHTEQYKTGPKVHASHILVDSKEKADELAKEVTPENFAQLAKSHSTCPSGQNGGDLGVFEQGQMVPEFDEKVFSMKKGDISEPVKTDFGYHIIYLNDIIEDSFDYHKDRVRAELKSQKEQETYMNRVKDLAKGHKIEVVHLGEPK